MRLKKDSKKSKAILLGIDVFLAVVVLSVLGYCGYMLYLLNEIPQAQAMEADIRAAQEENVRLEQRIVDRTQEVADAEAAGLAAVEAAQETLATVQAEADTVTAEHTELKNQVDAIENTDEHEARLREDIARIRTEYGQAVRKLEDMILAGESDYRICYLTFDDGPSYLTPNFLDKLDKYEDVYVTFFTIGVQMAQHSYGLRNQLMQREVLAGHALANHTYTHGIFTGLYSGLDSFMDAVNRQDELVYEVAGYHPDVLRFPAGSYYCPFRTKAIEALEEKGYGWIDWVGNAYDSGNKVREPGNVAANVIWQVSQDKVTCVLMHDWRTETLGALDTIIKTLQGKNYLFLPLFKESTLIGNAVPKWDD